MLWAGGSGRRGRGLDGSGEDVRMKRKAGPRPNANLLGVGEELHEIVEGPLDGNARNGDVLLHAIHEHLHRAEYI